MCSSRFLLKKLIQLQYQWLFPQNVTKLSNSVDTWRETGRALLSSTHRQLCHFRPHSMYSLFKYVQQFTRKKNRNKEFVFYTSEFFSAITHAQVWIGFLVSGVVVVAFFSLISYLANQLAVRTIGKRDLMNFGATTFYVWSTILSQGLFRFRIARRLKNCNVLLFHKDPIFVLSKRSLNSSQQHGVQQLSSLSTSTIVQWHLT